MTDTDWEHVPLADKHAFTQYMAEVLREHPTQTTEQQRRRYFETTMIDPRDLHPEGSVADPLERVKMGLPVKLQRPRYALGVPHAVYDISDASMFDPKESEALEDFMKQVKQVFADYVKHRREGRSTEAERRRLAHMTREFHEQTNQHLANLFKYAEVKIRQVAKEERLEQLTRLAALKRQLQREKNKKKKLKLECEREDDGEAGDSGGEGSTAGEGEVLSTQAYEKAVGSAGGYRKSRSVRLQRFLRSALGVDPDVARTLWKELESQTRLMQFCEVLARLTLHRGFEHTPSDEGLDAYTERIKKIYSVDAQQWGTLEVVQYLAAKESSPPVEWAARWYERLLLIPLQATPEYRRLQAIRQEEIEALALEKAKEKTAEGAALPACGRESDPISASTQSSSAEAAAKPVEGESTTLKGEDSHRLAIDFTRVATEVKEQKVVELVEKMFVSPEDPRLSTVHEQRLRYLAYVQMQEQIQQARHNAKRFAGVENSEEAKQCRKLYEALLERGRLYRKSKKAGTEEALVDAEASDSAAPALVEPHEPLPADLFIHDPEAVHIFEKIQRIVLDVIAQYSDQSPSKAAAEQRLHRLQSTAEKLKNRLEEASPSAKMEESLHAEREAFVHRLLSIAEKDIQAEMQWIQGMEEAERPPLLPVPEEGMSYVSAAEVLAWKEEREAQRSRQRSPFAASQRRRELQQQQQTSGSEGGLTTGVFSASFLGQPWEIPDKPTLFWGTGTKAVQQALEEAATEANYRRNSESVLPPPYPCAANPWGWRLVKDILDD